MRILHLTLKKKWFDMILSGEKREEYREMKPYWHKRLRQFFTDWETPKQIIFKNGYSKLSPTIIIEMNEVRTGIGVAEWGAPNYPVYIINLGKIISTENITTTNQ